MNHATIAINKAGLAEHPKSTILTGPVQQEPKFEEAETHDELVSMNMADTCNLITDEIRKSLYII